MRESLRSWKHCRPSPNRVNDGKYDATTALLLVRSGKWLEYVDFKDFKSFTSHIPLVNSPVTEILCLGRNSDCDTQDYSRAAEFWSGVNTCNSWAHEMDVLRTLNVCLFNLREMGYVDSSQQPTSRRQNALNQSGIGLDFYRFYNTDFFNPAQRGKDVLVGCPRRENIHILWARISQISSP